MNITLRKLPESIHKKIREIAIKRELSTGQKALVQDIYVEVIQAGIKAIKE
jgi:calcineurin-like phosphoesterase